MHTCIDGIFAIPKKATGLQHRPQRLFFLDIARKDLLLVAEPYALIRVPIPIPYYKKMY